MYPRLLLLYLLFLFKTIVFSQAVHTDSHSTEIEHVMTKVDEYGRQPGLRYRIPIVVDSIARQGDEEILEFVKFYSYLIESKWGNNGDEKLAKYKTFQPVITAFNSPAVKALNKFFLGEMYVQANIPATGIDLMLEAVSECEAIGMETIPLAGQILYSLSNYYYWFGNYKKCIEYARIAARLKDRSKSSTALNTWGLAYQKLLLYDSAVIKFKETIEWARKENNLDWISIASGNLGQTYCLMKNYDKGIPLLYFDVCTNEKSDPVNSAISALYISDAFIQMKKADSAKHYLIVAKQIFTAFEPWRSDVFYNTSFAYKYYFGLSKLEQLNEDYYEAFKNADTAHLLQEQYKSRFDLNILASSEKRMQGLEYQKSVELLAAKKKSQQVILLISMLSLGSISIVLISRQKIKSRKERQLSIERETNWRLRQQQSEQDLEAAKQQLGLFMANIAEKTELIEKITMELASVSVKNAGQKEDDLSFAREELYNASLLTNDEWYEFKTRFSKVYAGFFEEIVSELPGISPAEERMLALAKLKIDNRQIGQMLGISPASVRTAKYRLRKKLQQTTSTCLSGLLDVQEVT